MNISLSKSICFYNSNYTAIAITESPRARVHNKHAGEMWLLLNIQRRNKDNIRTRRISHLSDQPC